MDTAAARRQVVPFEFHSALGARIVLPALVFAALALAACSDDASGSGGDSGTAEAASQSGAPCVVDADCAQARRCDGSRRCSGEPAADASSQGGGDGDAAGNPDARIADGLADGGNGGAVALRDLSGCKRGLAYGHHSEQDMRALSPGVVWWYNWTHVPDAGVRAGAYRDLGLEYAPMIWGGAFEEDRLVAEIPQGAEYLLGFNEPNFGSQANLSALQAAALWPRVQDVAQRRGLSLVSPAVNYCGGDCQDTDPFNYLHTFLDACPGCQVDAIAIHIYVGCNVQWLIDHVTRYKAEFEGPLWLTEFACDSAATMQEQQQFMEAALDYLEAEPRIERYAWFAGRADNVPNVDLLGADGELTILGQTYTTHPHNPQCDP